MFRILCLLATVLASFGQAESTELKHTYRQFSKVLCRKLKLKLNPRVSQFLCNNGKFKLAIWKMYMKEGRRGKSLVKGWLKFYFKDTFKVWARPRLSPHLRDFKKLSFANWWRKYHTMCKRDAPSVSFRKWKFYVALTKKYSLVKWWDGFKIRKDLADLYLKNP